MATALSYGWKVLGGICLLGARFVPLGLTLLGPVTRIAKLAEDAATTALRDVTRPFAEDPEVGRLWGKGIEDIRR